MAELVGNGLSGIEVFYSEHNREQVENYLNLAKEFKLVATGGTDFHGDLNPAIKLGTGFGSLNVKDGILADMKARLTNHA